MTELAQIGEGAIGEFGIGDDVLYRSISSHTSTVTSSSQRTIDVSRQQSSFTSPVTTSISLLLDSSALASSEVNTISSAASRVNDLARGTLSHTSTASSFAYNERTSLELIDRDIFWNDDEAFWYTEWFQESRILGSEDTLAIRSLVVETAKEPCATVIVEYDSSGDGTVDATSDPIHLERDQMVEEIVGIPVDDEGYYRLKIMEYSGYNSLYAIDTAIVH